MIDTHCHLLPGLDDGPRNLMQALALARQLSDAEVDTVICTPHYSRRFPTDHLDATERLEELRRVLAGAEVKLDLGLAAEIGPATAIEAPAEELARRALGGSYLLVELGPDTPAGFVKVSLERLRRLGHRPVFAHPERCRAVRSQPRLLDSARQDGALVQVVAPSLTGQWGAEVAAAGWRLLESGRVDILASDAHAARPGGLHLSAATQLVARRLGADAVRELTERQPSQLIGQQPLSA